MSIEPTSRAIIDLNAYAHNLSVIRGMMPKDSGIVAVVKADAYGHGAVPVAKRAVAEGVSMLGVASVPEAIELREAGITARILVMVQPTEAFIAPAIEQGLRLTISDVAMGERVGEVARRLNKVVSVHCKIDTGMGRQGFQADRAVNDLFKLTRVSHIDIEGVCTHFAMAEAARSPFTNQQIKLFKQVLRQLEREGAPYEFAHAANSAAVVNHSANLFDMVRVGIMTYGVWPTDTMPTDSPLKPVLRWETKVLLLKELEPGSTIGYGRTYNCREAMRTALLPVGYADGYKYSLSNRSSVLICGKRCPVRGRVSMDQISVDVTHVPEVGVGDTATLIGSDGSETITVEELADRAATITYDILTGIGPRAQRDYVE